MSERGMGERERKQKYQKRQLALAMTQSDDLAEKPEITTTKHTERDKQLAALEVFREHGTCRLADDGSMSYVYLTPLFGRECNCTYPCYRRVSHLYTGTSMIRT